MSLEKLLTNCKLKTNYFTNPESNVSDFKADQCVIINEKYLSHVRGFDYVKPPREQPNPLEWFPMVNSYYNHAEDVCPYERVSKLLTTRPSLTSIKTESDSPYVTDPYSEKDAQLQYLLSRPVCFIILGKPGIGEEELGKKLAEYWRCVYMDPETLIKEEIESGTRAGECIEFNLRCGRAIGIDIILRLIEKRIKSKSAQHRGFVITGIPVVPNDLYEEDPVSSESAVFNVQEIFEEIYDTVLEVGVPTTKHVSIISASKFDESVADEDTLGEKMAEGEEAEEVPPEVIQSLSVDQPVENVMIDVGSAHENICQKPDIGTNCEEQLQYIFSLLEDPFVFIYVRCGNDDVISKRHAYRYHIYSDKTIDLQEIAAYNTIHSVFSKEPGSVNYEIPLDFFDIMPYEDTSKLQHLVKLPLHFPANVASQLNSYYLHALTTIEQHLLSHDPQYFLKVDGRTPVAKMFNIVKTRLEIMPLQKVVLPERLHLLELPKQGEEFDDFYAGSEAMDFEDCFQKLRRRDTANNMFKWNWSDWGKKCPVSMKEGSYKDGDINFAVHFMNKMFFLSDEDAFWKFYRNPRPFLLPPYPKPSCRIFVFGPSASGKTTISKCLGYLLSSTVLSIEDMKENFMLQREKEHKEKVKQAALLEAINLLNAQRQMTRAYREELLKLWYETIKRHFHSEMTMTKWKSEGLNILKIDLPVDIPDSPNKEYVSDKIDKQAPVVVEFNCDQFLNYLSDPNTIDIVLPPFLNYESGIDDPASVLDHFVISFAEAAAKAATYDIEEFSDEDLAEMFISQIKEIEDRNFEQGNNRGGWIIDGMLTNFNLLDMLFPDYIADDIFILSDQDNFLLKNYSFEGRTVFKNFRQLFFELGNVDAAWRSPDSESTASFKRGMVRDILYDAILNKYNFEDGTQPGEIDETVREPTWTKSVDLQADNLRSYSGLLNDLTKYFTSKQLIPIDINVSEKSITDLLKEAVKSIQDRYGQSAFTFSDQDRYEEYQDFGSPEVPEEGMFEGAAEPVTEDLFAKNRRYGDTLWYCPVTLFENWVLWKGKEELTVMYDSKIYLLATEQNLNSFIADPKKYLFANKPPSKVPPPRICVVGSKGCGKTTIAKALSQNVGLAYVNRTSIGEVTIEEFIEKIWFDEPLKNVGFVIDDFPKSLSDMTSMIEHKAIPDLFINIAVGELEIKNRLLNKALEKWREKSAIEKAIRESANKKTYNEWDNIRSVKLQKLMEEKREERYNTKIEHKRSADPIASVDEVSDEMATARSVGASSQVTYDSFAEQEDRKDIERMLDEEMPEPVFEDIEDDEEEAAGQLEEEIDELLANESDYLDKIREVCEQELITWIDLDGNVNEMSTVYQSYLNTMELKNRNKSMFERCYDISLDIAEQLLSSGYYFTSKFGRTCPVQYFKKINPIQMYIPMKEKNHLYAVIHRQFIYFLAGEENWIEFKKDPLKYIHISQLEFPLIPYRISVIGPPKSGKSSLVQRIQSEYSFKATTCGQAIRHVLRYLPYCKLAKEMEQNLRLGDLTTSKMQMESAEAIYFDAYSLTQGIIFDGFPNNQQEAAWLRDLGLMPHLILYLEALDSQVYERLSAMPKMRNLPVYNENFFNVRYNTWKENDSTFTEWMDREYQNIAKITTNLSTWHMWNQSQKLILAVFSEIKHYYIHAHDDWPLRIANMLITPLEYLERISNYKSFCPCCLYYDNALKNGGDIPDRTNLIHFTEHFYWICDNHIEEFLEFPEKFLSPFNKISLPKELPVLCQVSDVPSSEPYEDGVCMVCYSKNKQKKVFTMGVFYFAVTYIGRIYLFDSKECMDEFITKPHEYASLVINYKDPRNMATLKYNELPVLGYLEQYIAKDIVKAINDVAKVRPVIPGLSIQVSAAVHIALYLKLNCVKTNYIQSYKMAEEHYITRRNNLSSYLEQMKRYLNPYIYCEEPMPKFRKYTPARKITDYMRGILCEILDKVDYSKFYHGV